MSAGNWKEMFKACQQGDLGLVEYHLRMGVDPNHQHAEFMTTALLESIRHEHIEIVELLLQYGADPELKEVFGNDTPIKLAKQMKHKQILELLKAFPKS